MVKLSFELCDSDLSGLCLFDNMTILQVKNKSKVESSWDINPWSNFQTLTENSSVRTNDTQGHWKYPYPAFKIQVLSISAIKCWNSAETFACASNGFDMTQHFAQHYDLVFQLLRLLVLHKIYCFTYNTLAQVKQKTIFILLITLFYLLWVLVIVGEHHI